MNHKLSKHQDQDPLQVVRDSFHEIYLPHHLTLLHLVQHQIQIHVSPSIL